MRPATGVTVFGGMLGVTLFGLLLTPLFYVVLRTLERGQAQQDSMGTAWGLPRRINMASEREKLKSVNMRDSAPIWLQIPLTKR